jgi:hypothetical protein
MKYKIAVLLLFISWSVGAIGYYYFDGGNTVTLPASTVAATWTVRRLGTDTVRQWWVNDGLGYRRLFSATEAQLRLKGKADSTRLYGTTLPLYELISRKTATQSSSTTNYPNWLGITNYVTGYTVPATKGGTNITSYTTGDILYASATNTLSVLPIGSSSQYLRVTSGIPAWASNSQLTLGASLVYDTGTQYNGTTARILSINLANPQTWTGQQSFTTPAANDNSTKAATTAYVDAAVTNAGRGRVSLSGNVSGILNYDYLNATSSTYSIATPATTGWTADGSKIITGLVIGTGKIRVTCPSGYTIQTPSGFVTPVTGYGEIIQNQKFQLIPVGTNAYYLQPLNGSITVI